MKIAIIGASQDENRMSNKAVRAYKKNGHTVYPVNPKYDLVEGLKSYRSVTDIKSELDIISIYVNPEKGMKLLKEIIKKRPGKVILNPGSESEDLARDLREKVSSQRIVLRRKETKVTISLGVSAYPDDKMNHEEDLLNLADQALYKAKQKGKNRVWCF